ncbi:hypothetical protein E3N88_00330 [Mikania micrantha]|uniref:Retrotransposon Copia-like N-terminal domain-containing protein n=1 Tax=Mikania micrantha TaxID=192012 RepID=A0A5N6PXQ9_9ASTR|nr:hypothetical protein E3N88_00330 [Mikania micrantha]
MDSKLHPAITVSNIKNFIPITLEMETGQYVSWSELFKIHCGAFLVFDHLQFSHPSAPASSSTTTDTTTPPPKPPADPTWDRLDAIVLQWIYSTISNDLLHTILKPNTTAHDAWTALENLFQDNKSARAIHLDHKFANTRLENYPNMSAYCQELKILADQLANVDSPVSNQRLVLQLISGLSDQYEHIAMMLQQTTPLPEFYEARSRLCMEESRKANQALHSAQAVGTALLTTNPKSDSSPRSESKPDYPTQPDRPRGRGRGRARGRGRSPHHTSYRGRGYQTNTNHTTQYPP